MNTPITVSYEGQTVVHDGRSITACHETVDALCRAAKRLAPRFAEETLEAGCTNKREGGPRQLRAFDLVAQAEAWNLIAGELEAERDARDEHVSDPEIEAMADQVVASIRDWSQRPEAKTVGLPETGERVALSVRHPETALSVRHQFDGVDDEEILCVCGRWICAPDATMESICPRCGRLWVFVR